MQRTATMLILACILGVGIFYGIEAGAWFLLNPWITTLLLIAGLGLLISQFAVNASWGIQGLLGVLFVGAAIASHILAGHIGLAGPILMLAGLGLLIVEARIAPGHGIAAVLSIPSVFFGTYYTLGGAAAGLFYVIAVSLLTTALSFAALLAYLPKSEVWREMSRRIEVSVARPENMVNVATRIDTSEIGIVPIQKIDCETTQTVQVQGASEVPCAQTAPVAASDEQVVEELSRRCAELQTSSVPLVAAEVRLREALAKAKKELAHLEEDIRTAVSARRDKLATGLLLQKESCQARVSELARQLHAASLEADRARDTIETFRRDLKSAEHRIADARIRSQLNSMISQAESFLSNDLQVLQHIEEMADLACGRVNAVDEIEGVDPTLHIRARHQRAADALNRLKNETRKAPDTTDENQQVIGHDQE